MRCQISSDSCFIPHPSSLKYRRYFFFKFTAMVLVLVLVVVPGRNDGW